METIQINNFKIKPLITHTQNPDDVLGGMLFLDPLSNCAIIAKKKSGKTTTLFHILKKICRGGNYPTNVVIFCSTVHKDLTYQKILEMLKKKGCNVSTYTHFLENGENIIEDLLKELGRPKILKEEKLEDNKTHLIKFNEVKKIEDITPRKPSKISAEYVLVFDDMGVDMRNRICTHLSKVLRHYSIRCFYLQQSLTDMDAPMRKQLDYALLYRNFNEDKLKNIYESLDLSIPFKKFIDIYIFATRIPFHFLYIDVRNEKFRECFDKEIVV